MQQMRLPLCLAGLLVALGEHSQEGAGRCSVSQCGEESFIPQSLLAACDGPQPYDLHLPGNHTNMDLATSEAMAYEYVNTAGFTSARPDEAGRAFHLPCMFPVDNLDNIPDPLDDANWDWADSDHVFKSMVEAGLAPMLKAPVSTWQSARLAGLSYVDQENVTRVKIPPASYAGCKPWPTISGVIMARRDGELIGTLLVLKIALRYNDPRSFPVPGKPGIGALDKRAFARGFGGLELMNEWSTLNCFPTGAFPKGLCPEDGVVTAELWERHCFGPPGTWGSRYWDGRREDAWQFYAETALAIRSHRGLEHVRVGGPATGTSQGFIPCGSYRGIGRDWIDGFLRTVKSAGAPLDFFSFHYYGTGQNQSDVAFSDMETLHAGFIESLAANGFTDVPTALTEYNAPFVLGNATSYVGSAAGAAINAAKLVQFAGWPDFKAGFIYSGRDGAFEPWNPYSFPLDCKPQWDSAKEECRMPSSSFVDISSLDLEVATQLPSRSYEGCSPEDVLMPNSSSPSGFADSGSWGESCSTENLESVRGLSSCHSPNGDLCQFGPFPESGMGAFYASGSANPMGSMFTAVKSMAGSRKLRFLEPIGSNLLSLGVFALAWQGSPTEAVLLLVNPFSHGVPDNRVIMPSARQLLGPDVAGRMDGVVLAQSTFEGEEVPSDAGFHSQEPLVGKLVSASARFGKRDVSQPLPQLGPYDVVVFSMHFGGCSCDVAPETGEEDSITSSANCLLPASLWLGVWGVCFGLLTW